MTLAEIRGYALALPEVREATHFRLPAFEVCGKGFVVIQKGSTHAILSVDEVQAEEAAASDPGTYQTVRRNGGRIFVGVRVELAMASGARVRELVENAWRHKAPKRVSSAFKGGSEL